MNEKMSKVERKIYEDYVAMVKTVSECNGLKYDEEKVNDICVELAILSEKMLKGQEEETFSEVMSYSNEDELVQKIDEKLREVRGTGVFTAEAKKVDTKDDIYDMINDNIDEIFGCEQKVRGIKYGDVHFDIMFKFDDLVDDLCDTLTSVSND